MNYTLAPQSEEPWLIYEQKPTLLSQLVSELLMNAAAAAAWVCFFFHIHLMTLFHQDNTATRPDHPPPHARLL